MGHTSLTNRSVGPVDFVDGNNVGLLQQRGGFSGDWTAKIEGMSPDGIEQILLGLVVAATGLLLLRLMMLKLHDPFPLFTVSVGLGVVFGVAAITLGAKQPGFMELEALSLAIDFFLTPFVALELYRTISAGEHETQSWRFLGPIAASLLAGGFVVVYFASNPEKQDREQVMSVAFILDTLMTFCVLGYLISTIRKGLPQADRNIKWLRRFFLLTTAADAIDSFVEINLIFAGIPEKPAHFAYSGLVFAITAVCALALRKPQTENAPASGGTQS